jgi:hypothetical protein
MYDCIYLDPCEQFEVVVLVPYPREKGPMGGAPYIGPKLGGGLIFQVSVPQLDAKECPGEVLTQSSQFE